MLRLSVGRVGKSGSKREIAVAGLLLNDPTYRQAQAFDENRLAP
jgi:hypothetical protein